MSDPLDHFRAEEDRFSPAAVVLLDDTHAQTVAGLWLGTVAGYVDASDSQPSWADVWSGVDLDAITDELADASGIAPAVVDAKLRLLIRARLIYPDGTMSRKCADVLRARVVERIAGALKAAGGKRA